MEEVGVGNAKRQTFGARAENFDWPRLLLQNQLSDANPSSSSSVNTTPIRPASSHGLLTSFLFLSSCIGTVFNSSVFIMSGGNVPPPAQNIALDTSSITAASPSPPSSFWDRASTWASENKALVYTIAGVAVVVTGAGVVYYLQESSRQDKDAPPGEKRKSKKERRKEKKKAEEEKKAEVKTEEPAGKPSYLRHSDG
jgi:hypothetical protein